MDLSRVLTPGELQRIEQIKCRQVTGSDAAWLIARLEDYAGLLGDLLQDRGHELLAVKQMAAADCIDIVDAVQESGHDYWAVSALRHVKERIYDHFSLKRSVNALPAVPSLVLDDILDAW